MSQIQAAWSRVLTFTVKQYCFSQLKNKITWMCVCVCVYLSRYFYVLGENTQLNGYCL